MQLAAVALSVFKNLPHCLSGSLPQRDDIGMVLPFRIERIRLNVCGERFIVSFLESFALLATVRHIGYYKASGRSLGPAAPAVAPWGGSRVCQRAATTSISSVFYVLG